MTKQSPRDRLAQAAFDLFDERGYEQTTVDAITDRADLGRTTFFRHYRSKEDVIFPDHDWLLGLVRDRLQTSTHRTALAAVSDAVRLVLLHYLEEGDVARRRHALISKVPALRDREIASVARYQRLFREFITDWPGASAGPGATGGLGATGGPGAPGESPELRAELMAASVVAAHNHVLRRWLRGESPDPLGEFESAMQLVSGIFTTSAAAPGTRDGTTVVAFHAGQDLDTLLPALRLLLQAQAITPE